MASTYLPPPEVVEWLCGLEWGPRESEKRLEILGAGSAAVRRATFAAGKDFTGEIEADAEFIDMIEAAHAHRKALACIGALGDRERTEVEAWKKNYC
jgi:hypothetical protein